jgi:hypothetical protein
MRFDFTVNATQDGILLKTLLKQHGISKNLLAKSSLTVVIYGSMVSNKTLFIAYLRAKS